MWELASGSFLQQVQFRENSKRIIICIKQMTLRDTTPKFMLKKTIKGLYASSQICMKITKVLK